MKILFISYTRIGDAVLSTGVLSHLVDRYPDAQFTVACGPLAASLFDAVPRLDDVIVMTKRPFDGHWFSLWRKVRAVKWDLVVDLRRSLVSYFIPSRKRAVLGITDNTIHRISLISSVLDLSEPAAPHVYIARRNEEAASRLIPDNGPVLAIAPIAADAGKTWPTGRFIELAHNLLGPQGLCDGWRVGFFGGPADADAASPIIEALSDYKPIAVFGQTDLLTVYAALMRCQAFVGNDSGLSHLAAAAGLPTLAIFGPTNPVCYRPWGEYGNAVRANTLHPQIEDLSAEDVEAAFRRLLDSAPRSRTEISDPK